MICLLFYCLLFFLTVLSWSKLSLSTNHFIAWLLFLQIFVTASLFSLHCASFLSSMLCNLLVKRLLARSFSDVPFSTRTWRLYSWLESSPATVALPRVVVSISSGWGTSGKERRGLISAYFLKLSFVHHFRSYPNKTGRTYWQRKHWATSGEAVI